MTGGTEQAHRASPGRTSDPTSSDRVEAPGAAIEAATWRPLETAEVDGWTLGFAGGFTRRANSVLPTRAPAEPEAALERVEAAYAARGLPTVVRVDADAQPPDLDRVLAARGYASVATTLVMVGTPDLGEGIDVVGTVDVAEVPDDDWLAGWLDVKAAGRGVDASVARAVVTGSPALYLTARDESGVVGVARAGLSGQWVGLSCLMVAPRARRRGVARSLSACALAAAEARAASRVFLQVEASNRAAVSLYESLGLTVADTYHYQQR